MKSYLQSKGIKCWKAPDDILPGEVFASAIMRGISQCKVMVLVFSRESSESQYVLKEIDNATAQNMIVVPFRIEDILPSGAMAFYVSALQWIDAISDLEEAYSALYSRLANILGPQAQPAPALNGDSGSGNVSDKSKEELLSILPQFGDWATNAELRERLSWSKEKLKNAANSLAQDGACVYRDGSGGALALKTKELAELEQRLLSGIEPYPYFVNVGESPHRHWDDCRKYSFFCAGHGERFANQMKAIPVGSEVFLYLSQYGYVAMAKTISAAVPMDQYQVGGIPVAQLPLVAPSATELLNDHLMCEWLIGVEWHKTLDRNEAIRKKGLFVHVATSCRIKDPITIQYLRKAFAIHR